MTTLERHVVTWIRKASKGRTGTKKGVVGYKELMAFVAGFNAGLKARK